MADPLDERSLAYLMTEARTANKWQSVPVEEGLLLKLYDLTRLVPTSANCCPARFIFVKSEIEKRKLLPHVSSGNREKTKAAPVTIIVAHDLRFYEALPRLFPHADARAWFTSSTEFARETAFRNGSLQAAYMILMARALGLDAGPMSGFDRAGIDREFLADSDWKSDLLINVGYADSQGTFQRLPRLGFHEACRLI